MSPATAMRWPGCPVMVMLIPTPYWRFGSKQEQMTSVVCGRRRRRGAWGSAPGALQAASAQLPPRASAFRAAGSPRSCFPFAPPVSPTGRVSARRSAARKPKPKEAKMHYQLATRFGRNAHQISGREPLDNEALYRHVPSIFAREAHDSRSDRYVYVPTIDIVEGVRREGWFPAHPLHEDRKSTRLNSSHVRISYAVFCCKK